MTKISINQPCYLPWIFYFSRILNSDIFVILDHVEFEKNSFINRNYIMKNNKPTLLTIPVISKGKFKNNIIRQVEFLNYEIIRKKHLKSIEQAYSKSKFFNLYFQPLKEVYMNSKSFYELIINQLFFFLNELNLSSKKILIKSSDMNLHSSSNEMIIEICKKLNASIYISGQLGLRYLIKKTFLENKIQLMIEKIKITETFYLKNNHKIPSMIDCLFNLESEKILEILKKYASYEKVII